MKATWCDMIFQNKHKTTQNTYEFNSYFFKKETRSLMINSAFMPVVFTPAPCHVPAKFLGKIKVKKKPNII